MRISKLHFKYFGPFEEVEMDFGGPEESQVAIITGINGTGKSIILDVIRMAFGSDMYQGFWRQILTNGKERESAFDLQFISARDSKNYPVRVSYDERSGTFYGKTRLIPDWQHEPLTHANRSNPDNPDRLMTFEWVADFWKSELDYSPYQIQNLEAIEVDGFWLGSLSGAHKNADLTKALTYFDYLRSSDVPLEKRLGELLYSESKKIIELALGEGTMKLIRRTNLSPIISTNGYEVELGQLNSGSLFMIQRLVSLLSRMYSCFRYNKMENPDDLLSIPGILLIDEAENHLHPEWQKRLLPLITETFPNLQVICTTHSPFVVASVPNAKVFVTRRDPETRKCVVEDVSSDYAYKPVDEILISEAFSNTKPFSKKITDLLERRNKLIDAGDKTAALEIEAELIELNPLYFKYLKPFNTNGSD